MNLNNLEVIKSYPIRENNIILKLLLKDRTTNKNIIWASESYNDIGYKFNEEISEEMFKHLPYHIIKPRVAKDKSEKIIRTKRKGEVFTPIWVVKKKLDLIEEELLKLNFEEYIDYKYLEITCGEAPYITTRYDTVTGKYISVDKRVGFLDRKLQKISKNINNEKLWFDMVVKAYQSSYGYEYQGDSLFISRENLILSFIEYYNYKFNSIPSLDKLKIIANIISYNIFQMDGLKYTIPVIAEIRPSKVSTQLSFFEEMENKFEQLEIGLDKEKEVVIKNWTDNKLVKFKDLVENKGGLKSMKFDVVIGNPPYQEENKDRNRDDAIYHYFIDSSYKIGNKVLLITPGRFLFNVGSTPKVWNKKMLKDKNLKVIYFETNSEKIFKNTDIPGGIAITYRDNNNILGPIDVFTLHTELNSILKKVALVEKNNKSVFGDIMHVQNKFKLNILYKDYPEFKDRIGSNGKERRLTSSIFNLLPEIFTNKKSSTSNIGIYGRKDNRRTYKYINSKYLEDHPNLKKWKVFIPAANGSGAIGEVESTPVIGVPTLGKPRTGHTQTFISIGAFDTKFESMACLNYIKTKFARAMLGVMKVTQNNKTKETWSKVPIQDFTSNSDIDWTKSIAEIDQQLYKKYNLNDEEINFIESNVKEME